MMMHNSGKSRVVFLVGISIIIAPVSLNAYIDPGTTSVAFSALGYIVSIAAMGVVFFIRPLKNLSKSIYSKFARKKKISKSQE